MDATKFKEFDAHEKVLQFSLSINSEEIPVFIALHRIKNGISIGGTRMLSYESREDALKDALNLSKGMTYKCLLANIPYGGGKGVVFADPKKVDVQAVLHEYGKKINELKGEFYTGEDVGLTGEGVEILAEESGYIIGLPSKTGLPAPWAALGVFCAMKAAIYHKFGTENFEGKKIAIKGLGAVGSNLAKLLFEAGAEVYGADINEAQVKNVSNELTELKIVSVTDIHKIDVDVYAPCALGYDLTKTRVAELSCSIVCGAANNQLENIEIADLLHQKGILYIPDYIANAGGLIHVADELEEGGYQKERVQGRIEQIGAVVTQILYKSTKKGLNEVIIAQEIAANLNNG